MAAFFRQYIAPFVIVLIFLVALLAMSARIFLPSDMASPAPVSAVQTSTPEIAQVQVVDDPQLSPALSILVNGTLEQQS